MPGPVVLFLLCLDAVFLLVSRRITREGVCFVQFGRTAKPSTVCRHTCSTTWPLLVGLLLWWSSRYCICVGPSFPPSISPPSLCLTTSSTSRDAARCPSGKNTRRTAVKSLCSLLLCHVLRGPTVTVQTG